MNRSGLRLDQAPPLHLPLRFFLTAPVFGALAGVLLIGYGAGALSVPWAYPTVALTHLITLGVLTQVMMGALYQITPVLIGTHVPGGGLSPWVHGGLCVGAAAMVAGLLLAATPLLVLALACLAPALLIFLSQMVRALLAAPSWNTTVGSMALAVASLACAVTLGLVSLGEYAFGWLPLGRWTLTSAHLYLALGGWIGALITGVGQAVIPMFYLAKPFPNGMARLVLASQALAVAGGVAASFLAPDPVWHFIPLAFAALAVGAFFRVVSSALAGRKRKVVDTTLRFWWLGILSAPLSLLLLAVFLLTQPGPVGPRWLLAFGVVYLLGFAGSIMLGMLYKIVPFLIWLHRFSALAGKVNVPYLKDLIPEKPARVQGWLHGGMLVLLLGAALSGYDLLVRVAGVSLLLSFGRLGMILARAASFRPVLPADTSETPGHAQGAPTPGKAVGDTPLQAGEAGLERAEG